MTTVQIIAGTIGLAVMVLFVGWWLLEYVRHVLPEESDACSARVLDFRPSGQVASNDGGAHNRDLFAVQQDEHRRELRRRLHAATKDRGPARLASRGVPSDAA